MTAIIPNAETQFCDANGIPLAGGSVTFYVPGTTTLKATYRDIGQTTQNTNPVTLDSAGRCIAYGTGAYRQIVKDILGNTIWDFVTAAPAQDISGSISRGSTTVTNGQTIVTVPFSYTPGTNSLIVFKDGLEQDPSVYVETNSTTITFNAPLTAGTVSFIGLATTAAAGIQTQTQKQQVAVTAGQTVVTTPFGYTPGANTLFVFINGVLQTQGYTETSTTSVTFDTGLPGGVVAFLSISTQAVPSADASNLTYTPGYANSATTTLQNALNEFVFADLFTGVDKTGTADSTTGLNNAGAAAKAAGKKLWVSAGTYSHSGSLIFDSIVVQGEGFGTIFRSTDTTNPNPNLNIQLLGTGVKLMDCKVTTAWTGVRQSNTNSQAVSLISATNFEVARVWVVGAGGAGILGQLCNQGSVHDCRVENTLADGIHFTNASFNIRIYSNYVSTVGDDCIALVAYNLGGYAQSGFAEVFGNICNGDATHIGNGVDVVGWTDVNVYGNFMNNLALAAVTVQASSAYTSYNPTNVLVADNLSRNCGQAVVQSYPHYFLFSSGGGYTANGVVFNGNRAYYSAGTLAQAFRANGVLNDCSLKNHVIDSTGKIFVFNSTLGSFTISDCEAKNLADGMFDVSGSTGVLSIVRNTGECFGTPSLNRFINLNTVSGITQLTIEDNIVLDKALTQIYGGDSSIASIASLRSVRNEGLNFPIADVNYGVRSNAYYRANISGAVSLDFINTAKTNNVELTITANVTSWTFPNPVDGATYVLDIYQNGTGGFTVAAFPAAFKFPGGTAPVFTTTANSHDRITATYSSTKALYSATFDKDIK